MNALKPTTPSSASSASRGDVARARARPRSAKSVTAVPLAAASFCPERGGVDGRRVRVERHVDDAGRAAGRGGGGAARPALPVGAAGIVEVHVGVDDPGQDVEPGRVDRLCGREPELDAGRDDPPVVDGDVDGRAAADQEVDVGHGRSVAAPAVRSCRQRKPGFLGCRPTAASRASRPMPGIVQSALGGRRPAIGICVVVSACAGLAAFMLGLGTAPAAGQQRAAAATIVTVTAGRPSEFAFSLSRSSALPWPAKAGSATVTFRVANRGALSHQFKVCAAPVASASLNACSGTATGAARARSDAVADRHVQAPGDLRVPLRHPRPGGQGVEGRDQDRLERVRLPGGDHAGKGRCDDHPDHPDHEPLGVDLADGRGADRFRRRRSGALGERRLRQLSLARRCQSGCGRQHPLEPQLDAYRRALSERPADRDADQPGGGLHQRLSASPGTARRNRADVDEVTGRDAVPLARRAAAQGCRTRDPARDGSRPAGLRPCRCRRSRSSTWRRSSRARRPGRRCGARSTSRSTSSAGATGASGSRSTTTRSGSRARRPRS